MVSLAWILDMVYVGAGQVLNCNQVECASGLRGTYYCRRGCKALAGLKGCIIRWYFFETLQDRIIVFE